MQKILILLFLTGILGLSAYAQFDPTKGSVTGNFKLDAQSYIPDTKIGADTIAEKMLSNSYMNIIYNYGKFTTGVRFEGYFNTMLGYDKPYDGFGIGYKFATYKGDFLEITAGNFYEQFGNGLVFRTYEDRDLGYDNAMEGARVKIKPINGVILTGIIGKQRIYWEIGKGIVRGVDGSFSINDMLPTFVDAKNRITIGGSFVSKYQEDENPVFILPQNIGSGAGRIRFTSGGFSINSEIAIKGQDPSFDNGYIYKNGSSLLINSNYSVKGFGVMMQYKWVDNMSYRSERDQTINNLLINYIPAISKNHTYAFTAMYPYATQTYGEAGLQAELFYKFKRNTFFGGKYGTMLALNFARVNNINKTALNDTTPIGQPGTDGYNTSFLSTGNEVLLNDANIEITKKFNKKLKGIFTYQNLMYNQKVLQVHGHMINANIAVADVTWKIKPKHSLRFEGQVLFTKTENYNINDSTTVKIKQDYGNWAMLMLEYSISPHWFFAVSDQFNFITSNDEIAANTMKYNHNKGLDRVHYYTVAMGYSKGSSRIQLSYGKQREGILCVGGVCRAVPAAYGFNISITSTF